MSHALDPKPEEGLFNEHTHNGYSSNGIQKTLMSPVHEGGTDVTRFGEFNRVAGFYISQARSGVMTLAQAMEMTARNGVWPT